MCIRVHEVHEVLEVLEVLEALEIKRFKAKAEYFTSRSRLTSFEIVLEIFTIHTHFGRATLIHRMDSSVPMGNSGNV